MDDKDLTGKTCGIMDEETRRKMQADMDAQHNRIIEIGGMRFGEGQSELGREREAAHQNRDRSKDIQIPAETVTLAEARQIFDFPFAIPTWLPDGFALNENVRISGLFKGHRTPHISVSGLHPERGYIRLSIRPRKNVPNLNYGSRPVEENALSEVRVNGQPAAFISKTRMYSGSTDEPSIQNHPRLVWMLGDVEYDLGCSENGLTIEEMIRIAESVRHDPS